MSSELAKHPHSSCDAAAAESIGVFAEPEMAVRQLTPTTSFLVIASDGVFEFMPSQTVVDMVSSQLLP